MVAICSEWEEDWWCWETFSLLAAQSKWGLVSTKLAPSTIVFESMLHQTGSKHNCLSLRAFSFYFAKLLPLEWKLLLGIGFIHYRRLSIKICEFSMKEMTLKLNAVDLRVFFMKLVKLKQFAVNWKAKTIGKHEMFWFNANFRLIGPERHTICFALTPERIKLDSS